MSDVQRLLPRQRVPDLRLPLVGGGEFDLAAARPERFTLLVFYRGLHCPICRTQLEDLERKLPEFAARGVEVVAVSTDTQERAERATREWGIPNLRVAYGLPLETARAWGLYLSAGQEAPTSAGVTEPAAFSEPGLFLVGSDGTLTFSSVQTMPFTRPRSADLLSALDYIIANDYPSRGELAEVPVAH